MVPAIAAPSTAAPSHVIRVVNGRFASLDVTRRRFQGRQRQRRLFGRRAVFRKSIFKNVLNAVFLRDEDADFIPAMFQDSPLTELLQRTINPTFLLGMYERCKMMRRAYFGVENKKMKDLPRRYISVSGSTASVGASEKQRHYVYGGRRLPNPTNEQEMQLVKGWLEHVQRDGALLAPTVDDAVSVCIEIFGRYIKDGPRRCYVGFPRTRGHQGTGNLPSVNNIAVQMRPVPNIEASSTSSPLTNVQEPEQPNAQLGSAIELASLVTL